MKRLVGDHAPFATAADRKALVGKLIRYLRGCDIDQSGRGYFFPRVDRVEDAKGVNLIFESGAAVTRGELVELVIVQEPEGDI